MGRSIKERLQGFGAKIAPSIFAPKNASLTDTQFWRELIRIGTEAGVNVTPMAALGVPTVLACVNAISRSMASLPLKTYRRLPGGGKQAATEHPLYYLLHDAPNPEITSVKFRRALFANAVLRGNGYALIVRDGFGEVAELRLIANKDIEPMREEGTNRLYYMLAGKRVEKERILHISGLTFDGATGVDTMLAVREAIGLTIALQDHGARFFSNGSTPSVVLELASSLTPEKLKDFADAWDKVNTGNKNAHRRMILNGGVKATTLQNPNNEQSQFIKTKVHQDKAICQAFGVPQIKAGITDAAHFNNVWQENQSYIDDCLGSWAAEFEQAGNQRLFTPQERREFFIAFVFDGLLRGDALTRAQVHEKQLQNGIKNRNEVREDENMNPVPGGDRFMISQNTKLLDETGKPIDEQKNASTGGLN